MRQKLESLSRQQAILLTLVVALTVGMLMVSGFFSYLIKLLVMLFIELVLRISRLIFRW